VTLLAGQPGFERALVIRRGAPRIAAFPEPADSRQLAGAEVGISREGTSEPPQQRSQRQHVIPIVLEDPGQGRGPPVAKEVEVERRNEVAGNIVLADETEDPALQRR